MSKICRYDIILSNSICDIVMVKKGTQIFRGNGKTKFRPLKDRTGVLYAHINPNDPIEDRKVYVWLPESFEVNFDFLELTRTFQISPATLLDCVKDQYCVDRFFVTKINDLELIYPNQIKAEKIVNDGQTFAVVKADLGPHNIPNNSFTISIEERFHMGLISDFDIFREDGKTLKIVFPHKNPEWHSFREIHFYHAY